MFISFLYPINIRNTEAPYLWVFYKQLQEMYPEEVVFMGSKEYFYTPEYFEKKGRMEVGVDNCNYNSYSIPSLSKISRYKKYIFDDKAINKLVLHYNKGINDVWKELLLHRNVAFEIEIERVLHIVLEENKNIEGFIAWCNCPSLEYVANKYNLKVIYNEIGPFRPPYYQYRAYFDFSGVNGNTECNKRYEFFKVECKKLKKSIPMFEREKLLEYLSYYRTTKEREISYKVGVALQVEDDSNMLAYSNGFNNYSLIDATKIEFSPKDVLIRQHPGSHNDYSKLGCELDTSPNSATFINKCSEIHTINSSVSIEAILYGRKTVIYGDSPFSFLMDDDDDFLAKLNFVIISYLVPYQLLFCYDYYKWRMSFPNEIAIYYLHLYCLSGDEAYLIYEYEPYLVKKIKNIVEYLKLKKQLTALRIDLENLSIQTDGLSQKLDITRKDLKTKEKENLLLSQKLNVIKNSRGMRFLRLYYKIRDKLLELTK